MCDETRFPDARSLNEEFDAAAKSFLDRQRDMSLTDEGWQELGATLHLLAGLERAIAKIEDPEGLAEYDRWQAQQEKDRLMLWDVFFDEQAERHDHEMATSFGFVPTFSPLPDTPSYEEAERKIAPLFLDEMKQEGNWDGTSVADRLANLPEADEDGESSITIVTKYPLVEVDPEDYKCPKCGSTLGHRVNCPDGIAFTRERKDD